MAVPYRNYNNLLGFNPAGGIPIEPAVPGNHLPYYIPEDQGQTFIDPTGVNLPIPPEVIQEIIEATNADPTQPIIPPVDSGGDGTDYQNEWPIFETMGVPLPDPNPARVERMNDVQNAGNTQAAIDEDELQEPEVGYDSRVADYAAGTGNTGFDQNMVEAALDAIARNPAVGPVDTFENDPVELSPVASSQLSMLVPGQGSGVVDGVLSPPNIETVNTTPIDVLSGTPMSGSQSVGSIEDEALSQVVNATPASGPTINAGYEADLTTENNAREAEEIAQEQIANQQVNQIALNNMIGSDMLTEMAGRRSDAELAQSAVTNVADIQSAQNNARDMAAANALASGMAGQSSNISRLGGFAQPGLTASLAAPTQVQGVAFTGPSGRTTEISAPAPVAAVNPATIAAYAQPGLTGGFNSSGSIEDQASRDQAARAAPATNPGHVGAYGALGGYGLAHALADSEIAESRANNARDKATLSNMSDKGFSLGSLDAKLGLSPMQKDSTVASFASGLFGGINKSKAEAFNNPSMSLHDLTGQELAKDTYDPYAGTNFSPIGSNIASYDTSAMSPEANIKAEIDAINLAGNLPGVNINSFNMEASPYGYGSPQSSVGNISLSEDEEDEDDVGGYGSSGRSSGIGGISVSTPAGLGGFSGISAPSAPSATAPSFGGGNFGFSSDSGAQGFGSDSFGSISGIGGFSSSGSDGISVGGFGGSSFGNDFGNDGGFDGFGGFGGTSDGIGGDGSAGGFSDDTSGGFSGGTSSGSAIGGNGSSGGFSDDTSGSSGLNDAFGSDENGFDGYT